MVLSLSIVGDLSLGELMVKIWGEKVKKESTRNSSNEWTKILYKIILIVL